MKCGRHEIHEFDELPSHKVLDCDWNLIREESSRCPAAAGVAVGALLSPAAIGDMRNREHVSDRCIWNCGNRGGPSPYLLVVPQQTP